MTTKMTLVVCSFCVLFAALSVISESVKAADELHHVGADGVKWLENCDYLGGDTSKQAISGDKCGNLCVGTDGCNAFTYREGNCYLKQISADQNQTQCDECAFCGFLPWKF